MALPQAAFAERLGAALDGRLGRVEPLTRRVAFPLTALHARACSGPRLALVGDAAHVVHPLAGQGVNLGLLDAAALAEVLTQPDFPPQAFERELARMKVARQASKQSPSDIAEEAFYKALYRDHPYATPVGGTDASLAAITLDDVRAFYRKYYVAG